MIIEMNIDKKIIETYINNLTDIQKNNILYQLIDSMIVYKEVNFDDEGQMYNRHSGDRYTDLENIL